MAEVMCRGLEGGTEPDSQAQLVDNLLANPSQVDGYLHGGVMEYQQPDLEMPSSQVGFLGPSTGLAATAGGMYHLPDASAYPMMHGGNMNGMGSSVYQHQYAPLEQAYIPAQKHISLQKPEHEDSRAKRRGPMDEMRQLVRIMVKFLPQSLEFLSTSDEPGGGNRVTEPQIKAYLKATLGEEAPQPTWGMPNGWGAYLSDLFSWALRRPITDDEARSCACRQQGRSWQVKEVRLAELGIFAYAWPLPLTQEGVAQAQLDPGDPPPGSSFMGPPPGWPYVELPVPTVPKPVAAKPPARTQIVNHHQEDVQQYHQPMQLQSPRPAARAPRIFPQIIHVEKPTGPMEYDCVRDALALVKAAIGIRNGDPSEASDEVVSAVDEMQALLASTYGLSSSLLTIPAPAPVTSPHVHGQFIRAPVLARPLMAAPTSSPAKQPSSHVQPHAAASPRPVTIYARPTTGPTKSVVKPGPGSQPNMEDLVAAAMRHCKANGELITPSESQDRTTTSDQHLAGSRKRQKGPEGQVLAEEDLTAEAQSGLAAAAKQRRAATKARGPMSQLADDGAGPSRSRSPVVTAGDLLQPGMDGEGVEGQPGTVVKWEEGHEPPPAAVPTEVARLRSTIYKQMNGSGDHEKIPASEASISKPDTQPVVVNGFAVAGTDMLPLGSLPVSSRHRSVTGQAQTVGASRVGRVRHA